jgi:hypothetical protein
LTQSHKNKTGILLTLIKYSVKTLHNFSILITLTLDFNQSYSVRMNNITRYPTSSLLVIFCSILLILINYSAFGQSPTSTIGDRTNIGLYGGPAVDISYTYPGNRIFASVETPWGLFYSDDTCHTWNSAFPIDSLEYAQNHKGWGGGTKRVLTNTKNWVATHSGNEELQLSAAIISYNNGNTFQTAWDKFIVTLLNLPPQKITAIDLSDHFFFAGLESYLVRTNDTTSFNTSQVLLQIDTIPGYLPGSEINWIAASNDISGYPVYFSTVDPSGDCRLYKYYGNILIWLSTPLPSLRIENVFTHKGQITGDTIFISCFDELISEYFIFRSLSGGFMWTDITPMQANDRPIADADFSPDWMLQLPISNGLRLSMAGGIISDDLGSTWLGPGLNESFPLASHPLNPDLILTSNHLGVIASQSGLTGQFQNNGNMGFLSVRVHDFATVDSVFYIATEQGLAYTEKYYDPSIMDQFQWNLPNGQFPVPGILDQNGISAVAIDPNDSLHVICGNDQGFFVSFAGSNGFFDAIPTSWNTLPHYDPYVTDIQFITSNIVIAVTGVKFNDVELLNPFQSGNIWKSVNGGLTWFKQTPLFPDEFLLGNCIAVNNSGTFPIIYAGSGLNDNNLPGIPGQLWQSLDYGDTWSKINDGPISGNTGAILPIYDIDLDPFNPGIMYLSAQEVLARSDNGGFDYFITDIPYNIGEITSALIDTVFPDSITITAGRHLLKYNFLIDDADLKFKGLPGETFYSSSWGSVLGGSNTGGYRITEAPTFMLDLKAFAEGPFNGTDMNTDLNTQGFLPLSQPFNQPPWNYTGTESVSIIPNSDIVDWILIELRKTTGDSSTATEDTRFERMAAFLLKDGSLTDDDGITNPRFSIILDNPKGNEKVQGVVYTPSHVGERTANEMSLSKANSTFSYDFTTDANQVYGGASAHKEIAAGIWGMISGDGNHNGQVDNRDKNEVWQMQFGNTAYYFGDFNRDGTVNDIDKDNYWKPNAGRGSQIE